MSQETTPATEPTAPPQPEVWARVELMGHVTLAGKLTEEDRFGANMGRLEIPQADGTFVTQFFGGGSVYRITFVSEQVARIIAGRNSPAPISAWELPKQLTAARIASEDEGRDLFGDPYGDGSDDVE